MDIVLPCKHKITVNTLDELNEDFICPFCDKSNKSKFSVVVDDVKQEDPKEAIIKKILEMSNNVKGISAKMLKRPNGSIAIEWYEKMSRFKRWILGQKSNFKAIENVQQMSRDELQLIFDELRENNSAASVIRDKYGKSALKFLFSETYRNTYFDRELKDFHNVSCSLRRKLASGGIAGILGLVLLGIIAIL